MLCAVAGFFLVSVFALVLVSSRIIDSETVKSKVREFVADKTNGLARIEKIDLVWFPRPGVVIRDAAISFSTEIQGSVQRLRHLPLHSSLADRKLGNLQRDRGWSRMGRAVAGPQR